MSTEKLNPSGGISDTDPDTTLSDSVMAADVKSTDGKYHRLVFDRTKHLIEFTLTGTNNAKQQCSMLKDMNELLCVRGTPITLRRGIPVNLNKDAKQADTPNSLFFYFAEVADKRKWRIREIIALFTTSTEKKQWLGALVSSLQELKQRPKTLIVFVNPYGGKGKAKKIYANQVEKIFEMANIKCDVVMTERANHAFDRLKELDTSAWNSVDGVVSVGGDGLFNECLSAIVIRAQEDANKDITDRNINSLHTPRMRFGIIGAGSANSIVSSVHGTNDCPTAAIHIAMGSQCSVDVCTVHRGEDLMRISANAISYGWLGDVLADSERFRWMGPFRYQYSALRTTVRHPAYFGRVAFRLIPDAEQQKDTLNFIKCTQPCSLCQSGEQADEIYPYHVQTDFTHIICCVIPCVSPFTPYGLAPYAGIGDGSMDLAIVPKVSRCDNMTFMRRVAMHGGKYVVKRRQNYNDLNVFRVSRWSFTPSSLLNGNLDQQKSDASEDQGVWNLDGEIMVQPADYVFHFRLHPRLIKYFGRELDVNQPEKDVSCTGKVKRKQYSKIISVEQQ